MSCNTSESHVKPRPLNPLPANLGGKKTTLQKDSAARELGRERARERGGRGGDGGREMTTRDVKKMVR